jgi:hypothetical protein
MVVADGVTEGWYWTFFCVLLLNCIVPPLLLSSTSPWRRRQGAMLFDVGCDVFYIMGFVQFTVLHQGDFVAIAPTDVGSFFSNLFPVLRILSIGRVLVAPRRRENCQTNTQATRVDNSPAGPPLPSRLTPKVTLFFASLSLLMLATTVGWEQLAYPWNRNPCRPCQCSPDRVLERCEHGGTRLVLASRGITRVLPGAFGKNDLPFIRDINLGRNAITVVESGAFSNLPALKFLYLDQNRANTTSWFLESFSPVLRHLVPNESGLAFIEPNAFANKSQLDMISISYNSFASIGSLGGFFTEAADLRVLRLFGNPLTCEVTAPYFDGKCI